MVQALGYLASALVSALHPQRKEKGTVLLRKGDSGDNAYYVAAGEMRFPELNVSVGAGQLFGEMALLSADRNLCGSEAPMLNQGPRRILAQRIDWEAYHFQG